MQSPEEAQTKNQPRSQVTSQRYSCLPVLHFLKSLLLSLFIVSTSFRFSLPFRHNLLAPRSGASELSESGVISDMVSGVLCHPRLCTTTLGSSHFRHGLHASTEGDL